MTMRIPWQPIGTMPADRRDGRDILLCRRNTLGTVEGGDGIKLDQRWPFTYFVASFSDRYQSWWPQGEDECIMGEVDYWTDINPPEDL